MIKEIIDIFKKSWQEVKAEEAMKKRVLEGELNLQHNNIMATMPSPESLEEIQKKARASQSPPQG